MKVTDITKQKSGNRYNIYIDNQYGFSASDEDIIKYNIAKDLELDDKELDELRIVCEFSKAYNYALKLLTLKDYTEKQIIIKLNGYYSETVINDVIKKLKEYDFINDLRYANNYLKYGVTIKGYGKNKIIYTLIQRGIDRDIIDDLSFDDEDEFDNAVKLGSKKFNLINKDKNKMEKIYRYLASKGFKYEIIKKVIDYLERNDI